MPNLTRTGVSCPANVFFQITPTGAARFVTNEIIANRNIIVIIATMFPFELVVVFISFNSLII